MQNRRNESPESCRMHRLDVLFFQCGGNLTHKHVSARRSPPPKQIQAKGRGESSSTRNREECAPFLTWYDGSGYVIKGVILETG